MMLIAGITCACKSRQNARGISSEWCITPTIKQERGEYNIQKKRGKKQKNQKYSAPSDASLLQPREKEEEKKQQFQKKN